MEREHDTWARLGRSGPLVLIGDDDAPPLVMRVQLPNEPASATIARALVSTLLERRGTEDDSRADVVLAVSEASSNAIEYGAGDRVDMCVEVDGNHCLISVRNQVHGGDQTTAPSPGADMPSTDAVRGRGVAIIRLVMDDVAWDVDGEQCIVEMFRRLRRAS